MDTSGLVEVEYNTDDSKDIFETLRLRMETLIQR